MDILDQIIGEKSATESIGIQPIHIRLSTNVGGNSETKLTKNLIYIPKKKDEEEEVVGETEGSTSEYPYFTDSVKFPTSKILQLPRKQQIELFFNKKTFKKMIGNVSNVDEDTRLVNADYNFNALLNILLPTSFPIKNNIYETFSGNIKNMNMGGGIGTIDDDFDIFNLFSKVFNEEKNKYSYVSLNGKVYTVTKITRINDIINDPVFSKLLAGGKGFQLWRKGKIIEVAKNLKFVQNKYKELIDSKLENIQNQLKRERNKQNGAIIRISNPKSPANKANVPVNLLVPHFVNLTNIDKTQIENIISIFLKIFELKEKSGERSQSYIPFEIETLPGFKELLKLSVEYNVKREIFNILQDLNEISKYLEIKKDNELKDVGFIERRIFREIQNYDKIKVFLNELKQYSPPVRSYSNPNLSYILGEVKNNMDEFIKFIDFISAIKIEGEKPKDEFLMNTSMLDRLKTGVMSITKRKEGDDALNINAEKNYDALINLELLDGEIDDTNIEEIKCPYRDKMLTNMYKNMKYSNQKNPVLFYIDDQPFDMARARKTEKKKETIKTPKKRGGKRRGGFGATRVRTLYNSLSSPRSRRRRRKNNTPKTL
jgi:hypothetical protein